MKHLLLILALLFATPAFSYEITAEEILEKCRIELLPRGIFYETCPRGTLADGVDVLHRGPSPYAFTRVRCLKPVLVCEDETEKEDI